ncbi:MAG: hypothetical protein ABMA25_05515 [Ilumatobacteraceae bacterium]
MTAAVLATFHANAMTLVEIAAGLTVCASLLLLAVAPKRPRTHK